MTDTAETFRQGATAYRNARDWAKEQREAAIVRANEIANECQTETFAGDATSTRNLSQATATTLNENSRLSRAPRGSLEATLDANIDFQKPDAVFDEFALDESSSSNPSKISKPLSQSQRKRRHVSDSDYDVPPQPEQESSKASGLSQQFGEQDLEQEHESESN